MKVLLTIFILSLINCNRERDRDCVSYGKGYVTGINGPSSGKVNQDIPLEISFYVISGCGKFERFEESGTGKEQTISVVAKYTGCACTDNLPGFTKEYHFRAESAGTYYLRFESQGGEFISDTLVVSN